MIILLISKSRLVSYCQNLSSVYYHQSDPKQFPSCTKVNSSGIFAMNGSWICTNLTMLSFCNCANYLISYGSHQTHVYLDY